LQEVNLKNGFAYDKIYCDTDKHSQCSNGDKLERNELKNETFKYNSHLPGINHSIIDDISFCYRPDPDPTPKRAFTSGPGMAR
jgi:hypothetical protein